MKRSKTIFLKRLRVKILTSLARSLSKMSCFHDRKRIHTPFVPNRMQSLIFFKKILVFLCDGLFTSMDNIYLMLHACRQIEKGKVRFKPSNYHKSLIFNLQLRNRITEVIQLFKPGKFRPLGGFEGDFPFCKNKKIFNFN